MYPHHQKRALIQGLALAAIVLLAGYLRLAHNTETPGWYADEGTHLDIARHLNAGHVQYMAVSRSTLLFGRLPLFDALLAAVIRITGSVGPDAIGALRGMTGLLGVLSVMLVYLLARRSQPGSFALLAAFLLAIYPQAVIYNRFGFSYNLVAPLVLMALLGMDTYLSTRHRAWLGMAVIAAGVGALVDVIGLVFIGAIVALAPLGRRRDLLWSAPLACLPLAIYALVMLLSVPGAFLFDLNFTLSRLGGAGLLDQARTLAHNYTMLLSQDFWTLAGLVGLLGLGRLGYLGLWLLLLPVLAVGRTVALHGLSAYYMIPVQPLIALGAAGLLWRGMPILWRKARHGAETLSRAWGLPAHWMGWGAAAGACLLLAGAPVAITLGLMLEGVSTRLQTAIDPFLLNPQDARAAAAFINDRIDPDELVIASPALVWLLDGQAADFQLSAAAAGEVTPHLPDKLPADRLLFSPAFNRAAYVLVDPMWYHWGQVHIAGVRAMLDEVTGWPAAFTSGSITVYRAR